MKSYRINANANAAHGPAGKSDIPRTRRTRLAWAGAMPLALLLAACGGGSDSPASADPAKPVPVVGSATGVFTDAAVQGAAYTTSSGVTGTTDAQGRYSYNPNDTVSFKLGALALGSAPATAIVTPLELAGGSANRLQNLLVLLQSLDDDGVPGNGIKIAPAAAAALAASIDLGAAPAGFASSANAGLLAAMTAGGIGRAVTSIDASKAHFLAQSQSLLASRIWVSPASASAVMVTRIASNGESLGAEIGTAGDGGTSGLEYGSVLATAVDARGFKTTSTMQIDTNGAWGLSAAGPCERVRVVGDQLLWTNATGDCTVTTETGTLTKAENDPAGLVGVWALDSATQVKTQTFVFWASGKYLMLDPVGDTQNHCGGPGVEYGSYSYNASSQDFKVLGVTVDTNGCAGLSDPGGTGLASFKLTLAGDGKSATAVSGAESFTLFRVSN